MITVGGQRPFPTHHILKVKNSTKSGWRQRGAWHLLGKFQCASTAEFGQIVQMDTAVSRQNPVANPYA
ncbi:MAG: hypothetical protein WAS33_26630 [Candidatus Promineifilaceae bacterium]